MSRKILIAVLCAGCVFPLAYLVLLSVAGDWAFPHILPPKLLVRRWVEIFQGPAALGKSVLLSTGMALAVALLSTACGFAISRVIARHRRRGLLVLLAHVPFAMSPVILGTCLLYLFIRLELAGTVPGVILAQFLFACSYSIILFLGFWNGHTFALEQLVYTLGGNRRQMVLRMLLPVARPLLLTGFFQTFLFSWFDYGMTLVIGAGKLPTLTLKIFEYVASADFYLAGACATLLILPPLAVLLINRRLLLAGRI
ncbi:MAG: ABC transporter permease [Verrucomicrobiota bacterium]